MLRKIKHHRRMWHPFPVSWRPRVEKFALIIDGIQRDIETSVRFAKKYDKVFLHPIPPDLSEDEEKSLISLMKFLCPDLVKIGIRYEPKNGIWVVEGRVKGKTPKLKKRRLWADVKKN